MLPIYIFIMHTPHRQAHCKGQKGHLNSASRAAEGNRKGLETTTRKLHTYIEMCINTFDALLCVAFERQGKAGRKENIGMKNNKLINQYQ